jgi:hypothetical protein
MFEATTLAGDTVTVRASFWQCVKAGAAFAVGAAIVAFVGGVFWLTVLLPLYLRVMLRSLW